MSGGGDLTHPPPEQVRKSEVHKVAPAPVWCWRPLSDWGPRMFKSEPAIFRTWPKDLPYLSPSVWWAAANLCGWRMGYRAIGGSFRGDRELNEAIATRALRRSMEVGIGDALPLGQCAPIDVDFSHDGFALAWRGTGLSRKQCHARGKWYDAELSDLVSDRAAEDMARELGWTCLDRYPAITDSRYQLRVIRCRFRSRNFRSLQLHPIPVPLLISLWMNHMKVYGVTELSPGSPLSVAA